MAAAVTVPGTGRVGTSRAGGIGGAGGAVGMIGEGQYTSTGRFLSCDRLLDRLRTHLATVCYRCVADRPRHRRSSLPNVCGSRLRRCGAHDDHGVAELPSQSRGAQPSWVRVSASAMHSPIIVADAVLLWPKLLRYHGSVLDALVQGDLHLFPCAGTLTTTCKTSVLQPRRTRNW